MYKLSHENLGRLLDDVYTDLDVPDSFVAEAEKKYLALGEWLNKDSQANFKTDSSLYVQGSTLLGTSVKPIKKEDDYDFDLVYKRQLLKERITQAELKKQVGDQLSRYLKHLKDIGETDIPKLEEGKRCWTLQYKGKFHIDVLPAIPDPKPDYKMNPEDGLIITDTELATWQFTNPKGFHSWFKQSMKVALYESKRAFAKAAKVDIEQVPEDDVKTTLQKAIQILKRHRDATYKGDPDDKPISIIITTLAGQCYNNNENLYLALSHIVDHMADHIEDRDGVLWVENPINHKENFADKWEDSPIRAEKFMEWLKSAKAEFTALANETNSDRITEQLFKSFRVNDAATMVTAASKRAGLAAAASAVTVKTSPWGY